MNLPTQQQCMAFFDQYVVPPNIKAHCVAVQKYGLFLAQELHQVGIEINTKLLSPLLLLHDLFKLAAIENPAPNKDHPRQFTKQELAMRTQLREKYPGKFEGEIAYEVWKEIYPELALSLRDASNPDADKNFIELFAHYVDWCVLKEEYVGLDKRIMYLVQRYGKKSEYYQKDFDELKKFETQIFSKLTFTPQQLPNLAKEFKIEA